MHLKNALMLSKSTLNYVESMHKKLDIDFAHLTKAKGQIPPYWNDAKNLPEELPMHQHNVSSGRYAHAISQVALPYNSFFPSVLHKLAHRS